MKKKLLLLTVAGFGCCLVILAIQHLMTPGASAQSQKCFNKISEPIIKFGIDLNNYQVQEHEVKRNEVFAGIMSEYNITAPVIDFITRQSKEIFNLHKIKAGNKLTLLYDKNDSTQQPSKMIYQENQVDYVVFNLQDSLYVYRGQKEMELREREVSGVIHSSLYETLESNGINPTLAVTLSEIYAWSVDFYRIQKGDRFKIIYDEDWVEGKPVALGRVHCAVFTSSGKDSYAYYYQPEGSRDGDYYDENGNSMKKQFLKSPVKFSRISSRFTMKRFHPVTKAWKAHLGTDYAAPQGTPIMATADGVIEEAQHKVFNGNYVKIRHNGQYKTQYLHMSKIAKGIRPGARVKQGDVIGYVGSTGLATGPHVCYRFWKQGTQVDPLKQKLSYSDPLPAKYKPDYLKQIKPMMAKLQGIAYESEPAVASK